MHVLKRYIRRLYNTGLFHQYNEAIYEYAKIISTIGFYYYSIKIKNNISGFIYYKNNEAYSPDLSIKEITDDYRLNNKFLFSLNYGYVFNNEPLYYNLLNLMIIKFLIYQLQEIEANYRY